MKKYIYLLIILTIFIDKNINAQNFLNGSFENTTSGNECNYNLSNSDFNALMSNVNAFSTEAFQETDILVSDCFLPYIPDGTYALGLSNQGNSTNIRDAVSLELSVELIEGNEYNISFKAYGNDIGDIAGQLLIGCSLTNNDYNSPLIFTADLVLNQWTEFSFTFTAPNNGLFITVMPETLYENSWSNIDEFTIETSLSTENHTINSLKIYPNPSNDFIRVSGLKKIESYEIFNILGEEIKSGRVFNDENIKIENLSNGLYYIKINNNIIEFIKNNG